MARSNSQFGYLYDPGYAIAKALTPVGQDIIQGVQAGLNYRRAKAEAEMEAERLRAVRDRTNALTQTIETSKDPEEVARAREELNTTLSGYEFVPERPQTGKVRDWLAGIDREPRKLFTNEELASLDEQITAYDNAQRAKEEARQQAEWEARLPGRIGGELLTKYGKEPTNISPKGPGWAAYEEVRPDIEQQKVDIAREKANRAGKGGGGAGADEIPPKQADVRGFLGTFTKPLTTAEGYAITVRPAVQDWVNKAVYDIATQPNYGSATNTADSWLGQVWGTDEEKKAATARLNAARSNLWNYYSKKGNTGTAGEAEKASIPAATEQEIDLSKYHPR